MYYGLPDLELETLQSGRIGVTLVLTVDWHTGLELVHGSNGWISGHYNNKFLLSILKYVAESLFCLRKNRKKFPAKAKVTPKSP